MSTYNNDLHTNLVATLQNQAQQIEQSKSQLTAATFTLHYAQAAITTAYEKLETAQNYLASKTLVKAETQHATSIATNILESATTSSACVKQSVSNAAVGAANVQIAANAVVRLASDIGEVFNILTNINADSDIFLQCKEVNLLMNSTAYNAELASQIAMEASMLASQVSAGDLLAKAKKTNDPMQNLLQEVNNNFTDAVQMVAEDNLKCSIAYVTEKNAEAAYENIAVQNKAVNDAYNFINDHSNLNLNAYPIKDNEGSHFGVTFNIIHPPFLEAYISDIQKNNLAYYPVKDYYLFLVKDNHKSFFSTNDALNILANGEKQYISLSNFLKQDDTVAVKNTIALNFNYTKVLANDGSEFTLQDTDEDELHQGTKYVVFLLANFYEEYKKELNNFNDFLSAPSPAFCLTQVLAPVNAADISVEKNTSDTNKTYNYNITFTIAEQPTYDVVYRCLLLPETYGTVKGLLNNASAEDVTIEVKEIGDIATKYDPKITTLEAALINSSMLIENLKSQNPISDDDATALNKQLSFYETAQHELTLITLAKSNAIKKINVDHASKINFFFNKVLAEQVPASNYIPAIKSIASPTIGIDKTGQAKYPIVKWEANINASTTDIFGNKLVKNKAYIPVILSISAVEENNLPKFTNNWSGYENANSFEY
jgi:hypothetical protein